jgi:asparagine synthase (glutamine-hydrolysing)
MCGINGMLDLASGTSEEGLRKIVGLGAESMEHGGPDDSGVWVDAVNGIALAHRRLSILDLSAEGHQPMTSHRGRFVVVFNGEIYNYAEIRAELDGSRSIRWRGHSDTEVILEAFAEWGVFEATRRMNGMFAFAVWDAERRELTLGRDRLGEKPLYYAWLGSTLVFGSELRALRAHPRWNGTLDANAIRLLLRHNYVPAPLTIYEEARKLPPGTLLVTRSSEGRPEPTPYWSVSEAARLGAMRPFTGTSVDAVDELESLLSDAVRIRMVADVPVGAFLSGGIDSSAVVSLMQAHSSQPVRTFSIGFEEAGYDEAVHARAVARALGTEHTEQYVTASEAQAVVPHLAHIYDEPFADSSQIPTFLLAAMTRRHVTVSLSGDGGDELFCGYDRYARLMQQWSVIDRVPRLLRGVGAAAMSRLPRLQRAAELLAVRELTEFYLLKVSHWSPGREPMTGSNGFLDSPAFALARARELPRDPRDLAMTVDLGSYLPDDILVKVDRATMAVSLEGRIPLLDHRIVEWALALPLALKVRNSISKWVLRQVAHRRVPPELLNRSKQGFAVPLGRWLRGPLRDWADGLLSNGRLLDAAMLDRRRVAQSWTEHLREESDQSGRLWTVLMLLSWVARQNGSVHG